MVQTLDATCHEDRISPAFTCLHLAAAPFPHPSCRCRAASDRPADPLGPLVRVGRVPERAQAGQGALEDGLGVLGSQQAPVEVVEDLHRDHAV